MCLEDPRRRLTLVAECYQAVRSRAGHSARRSLIAARAHGQFVIIFPCECGGEAIYDQFLRRLRGDEAERQSRDKLLEGGDMGRKRNGGALDDLLELAAMLPWWVDVVIAAAAYVGFHMVAVAPLPPVTPGQLSGVGSAMWKGVATAFQYILPLVFLAGAAASAFTRYKRKTLVAEVAGGESAAVLGGMSWQEFEALVSEAFRLEGFQVAETGGGGPDGGVDLVLRKGKEKYLVQCKQWQAFKVGVTIVRELYGVMAAQGAAGGYVVTSGKFTSDAVEFASGRNVTLVDGQKLFAMFDAVRKRALAMPQQQAKPAQQSVARERPAAPAAPACPNCGKAMVQRVAKQGANAGKPFWGCPGFPGCRGVRPIA